MDKRISVVGLTDEGKRFRQIHCYIRMTNFLDVLFSDLSEDEQEELYRLLGKLKRPIFTKIILFSKLYRKYLRTVRDL